MKKRIISGTIGAVVLVAVLLLPPAFLYVCTALFCLAAVFEMLKAVYHGGWLPLTVAGLAGAVAMSVAFIFNKGLILPVVYLFTAALFIIYMAGRGKAEFKDVAKTFFISVYISVFFGHIILIRLLEGGAFLIWTVFIAAFMSDTFAYFSGRFFGKHKLAPVLSPKKTVEGAIGAVIGAALSCLVYGLVLQGGFSLSPNLAALLFLGASGSVVAQFGDLAASAVKRQYTIKDYGDVMPGHGGIMDRFDSVLFVAPFVYYYITLFPIL